jgi:hypothetical protein
MKKIKWIILSLLILAVVVFFAIIINNSSTVKPDEFSLSSSILVQENWNDNFIGSIKLVINSDEIYINGVLTIFDIGGLQPILYNNRVFLPINLIANLIRATIRYNGDRNVIIEIDGTRAEITVGQNTITVNNETKILEAAPIILNDIFMVPLGIMEFLGFDEPIWDIGSQEIVLVKTYQTHRLIVVTNGSPLTETYGAIQVIEGTNDLYVLQYSSEQAAREADRLFNENPDILFSQSDTVIHTEASVNNLSWGVGRVGAGNFSTYLQNISNNNEVIVAVLDTGIDFNHPFLRNRISDVRWNFIRGNNNPNDVNGHGSHVSGIIIDSTPSNVKIMPLKVLGDDGIGTVLNIHNAIIYAADNGADVINMSLGSYQGRIIRCPLYERAIDYALSKNVIVVVSAGNSNGDVRFQRPAYYSRLITVAATDQNDNRASFSNFGDGINIAAPGVSINSAIPGGRFTNKNGTSMSAPFVSASAALLRSTDSSLSQDDVIAILSANADNVGSPRYFGAGIVNVVNLIPADIEIPEPGESAFINDTPLVLWQILLGIVPFITLLLLSNKVNLKKQNRYRQFILPLVALIYCVAAVLLVEKINEWIAYGITLLGQYIPFITTINLTRWLIFIFNSVIVIAFFIIKGILLPIVNAVWSKTQVLTEKTSGNFYVFDDQLKAWVLKDEYGQAKSLWKGFYWFSVIISSVILVLSQVFPRELFFQIPFYPVVSVLVLGEILFFLSGLTKQELLSTIAGDEDESNRIANYGLLRREYLKMFGNRILHDDTAASISGLTSFDMLDNLAESENVVDSVISNYFIELKQKGMSIESGFVRSSIDMVNGKSVLLNTPFYHDLTAYIILPIVRRLLKYEKALVIVGRDSSYNDVLNWLNKGITDFCGTPELWKTEMLTDREAEIDVGVLRFADIYNRRIIENNSEFLGQVGFVLLIEPSRIITTGQVGLSLIIQKIEKDNKNITFCSCDRNCDGLVDALSHILKVELTEVYATVPTLANCSLMFWNAHGEYMHHKLFNNVARSLGMGAEISAVALKHQIKQTIWVSSERYPVYDIWITKNYFHKICEYIGRPESQEALNEVLRVDANLWNLEIKENAFITVEDEFYNLFEMSRLYSTRAENQAFVNVICENYLLRDYMVDNAGIFETDSKIIPTIAPAYAARTERNTIVGLIMRMFSGEVSENELKYDFSLASITNNSLEDFRKLVKKHCYADNVDITIVPKIDIVGYDLQQVRTECYTLRDNRDIKLSEYEHNLSNAYFIIEDEKDKNYYLGAMLYGHVFQMYLPGQCLTYSGKYYLVQTITPESGVVLNRASEHIADRRCYRQRREYTLKGFTPDSAMGSSRTSRGIELSRGFCEITVDTKGYYELYSYDNLASAHKVDLNGIPVRAYRNKTVLRIKLAKASESVRFTIALLLNEIFKTIYPETYHYVTALVKMPSETDSNIVNLIPSLQLFNNDDTESIYIVEDSEIDLGLLVSIDRNLVRLLEIIADYLMWLQIKLSETDLLDEKEPEETTEDESAEDTTINDPVESEPEPPQKFSDSFYLLYGYKQLDKILNLKDTIKFFGLHGYDKNALEQARKNSDLAERLRKLEEETNFKKKDARFCYFCFVELSGCEYDLLADGRERCVQCSNSALKTVEQYTRIYENSLRNMETFFGIRIKVPIKVRMANAKKIAKLCGTRFIPSPFAGRVLAFAKKESDGSYTIYVENGSPKIAAVANIVHELTHIWQFANWNKKKIRSYYRIKTRYEELVIYEGMAKWAEIQYLYFLNEISYAKRQEIYTEGRNDEYGEGFRKYRDQYPIKYRLGDLKSSPFSKEYPLELGL